MILGDGRFDFGETVDLLDLVTTAALAFTWLGVGTPRFLPDGQNTREGGKAMHGKELDEVIRDEAVLATGHHSPREIVHDGLGLDV